MANPTVTRVRSGAAAAQVEFEGLTVADGGAIDTSCEVDFALCSIFKCAPVGEVALTPKNIGVGRTVKLHIRSGAEAPTLTFGVMDPVVQWLTTAPTFTNSKMTVVTLTNDGTKTVGSFVVEA